MNTPSTYEDRLGPIRRRLARIARTLRWHLKGLLGVPREILVEMNWRLGDEIMALPVYDALKQQFPSDMLSVLTNYPDLFEESHAVDKVNPETPAPDRYILLRGAPRHVHRLTHYAQTAAIEVPPSRPHVEVPSNENRICEKLKTGGGALVAVCAGASWETKRWPIERWKELCASLVDQGYHVVELGQENEAIGVGQNFVGSSTIAEAAAILDQATLYIGNDSGLMHLARAVDTPVVALFGPTEPTILIVNDSDFHAITNERPCKACWNTSMKMVNAGTCPLSIGSCLESIQAETVLQAAQAILKSNRPQASH